MPVTGSRIVLRGSEEVGMCHELPMEFTTTLFVTGYGFQKIVRFARIRRSDSTQSEMNEIPHAANGIRFPVWCLAQVRVAISPDQSDDGLCDDTSAHRSQTNWFLIAFAALCRGSFGPFDLRFRQDVVPERCVPFEAVDRKSTRLNSSHVKISYAVFCLKKKK